MEDVNISELRQNLPTYIDEVRRGREIRVTVRGRVVARIVPEGDEREAAVQWLKALRGKCRIGDVVSPTPELWDAERDHP